jgi:hypothetical protein
VRRLLAIARVTVAAILLALSVVALGSSIANSHYDPQTDRAPAARIALAAVAVLIATGAVVTARRKPKTAAALTLATLLCFFAWYVAVITTGTL